MLKSFLPVVFIIFLIPQIFFQNTGINTTNPDNSAVLHLESSDKGLIIPRLTTAERNTIDTTGNPLSVIIFNTDDLSFQTFVNSKWHNIWCLDCAPSIVSHPSGTTVCAGNSYTFSVSAQGMSLTYKWKKDGTVITGATGSSYTINNISNADAGTYTCEVSGACSPSVVSNGAVLTVESAPSINSNPSNQTAYTGNNTSFSVSASGGGLIYQWQLSQMAALHGLIFQILVFIRVPILKY